MTSATTYDFIVVGSGSGGGVVAARLSESGKYTVACVEAGTRGAHFIWTRPPVGGGMMISDPSVNWCQYAQPNPTLGGRQVYIARGKILGGSSAINGLIYNRGQSLDYDAWERMGCTGWSYKDVLPWFKKLESTDIGTDEYRGRTGPMKVTVSSKTSPFYDLFIRAAQGVGLPLNPDYSAANQCGVAMAQINVWKGLRQSTATQYLYPARKRPNLSIIMGAHVTSLILEGTRCVGVRYVSEGQRQEIRARREVVICAGTIGTPQLLELSGIGNPEVLEKHGIAVVRALPGVGENLRDHFGPSLQWTFNREGLSLATRGRGWRLVREVLSYVFRRKGFISQGLATLRVFTRSHEGIEQADIALMANPFMIEVRNHKRLMSPVNGFFVFAQVQRPESAGSTHIQSADPLASPTIHYNFLSTEKDCRTAVMAVRRAREIVAAEPLAQAIEKELLPGPQVQEDAQILEYCRHFGNTTYHPVGTCKMGPATDPMAVVDPQLRVYGMSGLRIADCSIMPMIISGNTSIPAMMIGERCAHMVLADAHAA
ncbi:GMC family oxidoreductase [Hydrogenophaga sp.]|uniref:GMC family oxidoreductase n=1 Tax=Hydrogenophaga sp. TaxID=1904254 RepID=UPI00271BE2B3|nr:GMC family oxidoreductase N-terminal domain-containing protein [Hydrogenophaga sp.]MDO9437239.1 GMC family oxidoreductase N-terminal domain-containing protein [Hydrogenophaga sp.]